MKLPTVFTHVDELSVAQGLGPSVHSFMSACKRLCKLAYLVRGTGVTKKTNIDVVGAFKVCRW